MAHPSRPPSVFFSYSRADLAPVRALAQALRACGVATWLDVEDLQPGQRWKDAIGAALAAADAMVFCLSGPSLSSSWTRVELDKARALDRRVLPVAVQPLHWPDLPHGLADLQGHDMSLHPPALAPARTARAIGRALGLALPEVDADTGDAVPVLTLMMDPATVVSSAPATLALAHPELVRLDDLLPWAARARRVQIVVGPGTDPALLGLVVGGLVPVFGADRLTLQLNAGVSPAVMTLARVAGVRVASR
jgi:hypothetical protein